MADEALDVVGMVLDGRYRVEAPLAEGVLLREHRGVDTHRGAAVSLWLPHRLVAPAFEDIEEEIELASGPERNAALAGCRRVLDLGHDVAYIVGATADHPGPRPRRTPYPREVVAGWFRAIAGIIDRNHRAGRWHGLLTCDDVAILEGKLVVAGFGFWVRADPELIASALAAPGQARVRELCAPEVAECAIGPAADLWALGRCTLALVAGAAPEPLPALRQLHPRLAGLLEVLLQPDPEARVSDLRTLADKVTRALEEPYREGATPMARPGAELPRGALAAAPPDDDGDDTATARYEPTTGRWQGLQLPVAPAIPTPLVPQAWSPSLPKPPPIQVISMKPAESARPRRAAPLAPAPVPVIRRVETAVPVRPTAAALGTIAPPRARTQPAPAPRRRWPTTLLVILLALTALAVSAYALWG